jgi:hypothetical protein
MHRWGALAGVAAYVSAVVAVAWWFGFAGIGLFAGLGVALLFRPVHLGVGNAGTDRGRSARLGALPGGAERPDDRRAGGKVVAYLALAVVGLPLTLAGLGLTQVENVLRQRYRDWAAGRVQAQVAR